MKRIGRALVLALGLSLVMAAAAFAWENRLQGQPPNFNAVNGYSSFVWNDDSDLHLRTSTSQTSDHDFTGTIETDGYMRLKKVLKTNDVGRACVCPNGHTITFVLHTWKSTDGFDYTIAGGTQQTVTVYYDGTALPVQNILLGANGVNPTQNPFTNPR